MDAASEGLMALPASTSKMPDFTVCSSIATMEDGWTSGLNKAPDEWNFRARRAVRRGARAIMPAAPQRRTHTSTCSLRVTEGAWRHLQFSPAGMRTLTALNRGKA